MSCQRVAIPDISGRPTVEVRLNDKLIKRVSPGAATMLVVRGWAEWRGSRQRPYVALTDSAPLSALHGWRGIDGTRAMRGDQTCRTYADGQSMGDSRIRREFIPSPEN